MQRTEAEEDDGALGGAMLGHVRPRELEGMGLLRPPPCRRGLVNAMFAFVRSDGITPGASPKVMSAASIVFRILGRRAILRTRRVLTSSHSSRGSSFAVSLGAPFPLPYNNNNDNNRIIILIIITIIL